MSINDMRQHILNEVDAERHRQDEEWGGPEKDDTNHLHDWTVFIVAHLGKGVAYPDRARYQLIRVAALAVAAVESMDRLAGVVSPQDVQHVRHNLPDKEKTAKTR